MKLVISNLIRIAISNLYKDIIANNNYIWRTITIYDELFFYSRYFYKEWRNDRLEKEKGMEKKIFLLKWGSKSYLQPI